MQVKKQQLDPNIEQQTDSKLGKKYIKAVYLHQGSIFTSRHPAYLTSMQSTSCKMPGWMKHKTESRLPGEISIILYIRYADDTNHSNGRKLRGTKEVLDEGERGEWKSWLKTQHSKS